MSNHLQNEKCMEFKLKHKPYLLLEVFLFFVQLLKAKYLCVYKVNKLLRDFMKSVHHVQ